MNRKNKTPEVEDKSSFLRPEYLDIITTDCDDTKRRHQGISCEFHEGFGLYRLDYSIVYPKIEEPLDKLIPANFVDLVHGTSDKAKKNASKTYQAITKKVKDNRADEAFTTNSYKKALTFSFLINPEKNYANEGCLVNITQAKIETEMTYQEANENIDKNYKKMEPGLCQSLPLYVWQKMITKEKFGQSIPRKKADLSFEETNMRTGYLVQKIAAKECLTNNVECILRKKGAPALNDNTRYLSTGMIIENNFRQNNYTLDITNNRTFVPAMNNLLLSYHQENGEDLLTRQESDALARMTQLAYEKQAYKYRHFT